MKIPGIKPGIVSARWDQNPRHRRSNHPDRQDMLFLPWSSLLTGQYMPSPQNNPPEFVDSYLFFRYNSRAEYAPVAQQDRASAS